MLLLARQEEEKKQQEKSRKSLRTLTKRLNWVVKGYERNLVTKPQPNRFYDSIVKAGETHWAPVLLEDETKGGAAHRLHRNTPRIFPTEVATQRDANETATQPLRFLRKRRWDKGRARALISTGPEVKKSHPV